MNLSLLSTGSGVLLIVVGLAVVVREDARREALLFLVLTLTAGLWLVGFGRLYAAPDAHEALHWVHVAYLGIPFIPVALYHFTVVVLGLERNRRWVVVAGWVLGLFLAGLAVGTDLFVARVERLPWGWFPLAGPAGPLLLAYFAVYGLASLREYLRRLSRATSPTERKRIQLLVAGFLVAHGALVDFLPSYGVRVPPVGFVPIVIFMAIAGWAVWRYRLVDLTASFAAEQILRTLTDPVLVVDPDRRVRVANPALRRIFGWSEDEIRGRPVETLAPDGDGAADRLRSLLARDRVEEEEVTLRHRNGDPVTVTLSTSTLEPVEERPAGKVILLHDVRQRKEASRMLEESEQRYRSLFDYNPDAVYGIDTEGRFVALNPASRAVTGHDPDSLLGRSFGEILYPADRERGREVFERVLGGDPQEYELRLIHRDGHAVDIEGVSVPVVVNGEITGVYGIARDVTEARREDEAVRLEREYFATLFDSAPDAIAILGGDDRVQRVNEEFQRLFGYTEGESRGRSINELIVPEELRDEGIDLTRRVARGDEVAVETVRRRKDGSTVEVSIRGRSIRAGGRPVQVYGIYRDISRRKATERELREKEEQLRHAQRLESVGRLAGGIAHDFNNILTVVMGHARMALDDLPGDGGTREDVEAIHRAAERAAKLTNQLLAFSRRQVIHPRPADLNAVVRETEKMLDRLLGEPIQLETRLQEDLWPVRVDPSQIEQVIVNLALNARDAMPEGGRLVVETENTELGSADVERSSYDVEAGEYVALRVTDTGGGMDPETLNQVFDPFFTTKERGKGTGLGLAMVFGAVKQSGGYVWADSTPGEGSTFTILLPREVEGGPSGGPLPGRGEEGGRPVSGTILVVEDERPVRLLMERILRERGFTVMSAASGEEALGVMLDYMGVVDLVVSDAVMPGMGGRELARMLRERWPAVRILLVSGYDAEMAGAVADTDHPHLEKPFAPENLLRKIDEVLATR